MNTMEITNVIPETEHTTIAERRAAPLPLSRALWEQRLRFALYGVTALLMIWLTASVLTSLAEVDSTLDAIRSMLAAPSFNF